MTSMRAHRCWTDNPLRRLLIAAALLAALAVVPQIAAGAGTAASVVPAHAKLTLRSSPYGKVLFDANRRVLYLFAADRGPRSTCYGICAKAWPPLLTRGKPVAGTGLKASLLGTTRRKNGSLQVTYNGHPLYYFEEDKAGQIMCQHADMHGGFWYVVNANGTPNRAKSKTHM